MERTSARRTGATLLALGSAVVLGIAVTAAAAQPSPAAGASSAMAVETAAAPALSRCQIVITAAPWHVGTHAGSTYTIAGKGMSCASARGWVAKFTRQQGAAPIKGPAGYACHSFSTPASGDKLLYSGVCARPPHNTPFFEWAPKLS